VQRLTDGKWIRVIFTVTEVAWDDFGNGQVKFEGISIPLPSDVEIRLGQRVEVVGKVKVVEKGKRQFKRLEKVAWKVIDTRLGVMGTMLAIREKLGSMVLGWLPNNEAALGMGIVLGGSDNFTQSAREQYSRAGLSHVVAASGYNVTVVVGWVMVMTKFIKKRWVMILIVILSIIVYVLLAGLSVPVIRAGIMGGLVVLGKGLGRKSDAGWLWIISGLGMLIAKPGWLENVSFQLSMAATAGMIWLTDMGGKVIEWWKEELRVTLAAQIITLPIILHNFGALSIFAPITNLAVLWVVPMTMQILAVAMVVGVIWNEGGMLVSWLCWPLLKYFNDVTKMVGVWDMAVWEVGNLSWGWGVGFYLMVIAIVGWRNSNKRL
jgi:competence protein ComEC